jgi:hypothetical protein
MILTPSKDIAASKEEHDLIRIPATTDKAAMELSFSLSLFLFFLFFLSLSRRRLESNSGPNNRSRRKSVARKDEKLGEMRSGRKTKQSAKKDKVRNWASNRDGAGFTYNRTQPTGLRIEIASSFHP